MDKLFFWKDLSGRGFTNTFTEKELLEVYSEYEYWEDCEECDGKGEIEKTFRVGDEGMKIEMDAPVVCIWCEGKKKVLSDDSLSVWIASAEVGDEKTFDANKIIRIK